MFNPSQNDFSRAEPVLPGIARAAPVRGLLPGTHVETLAGWRAVERLAPGDMVETVDGGLRRLRATRWRRVPEGRDLIHVPAGVLCNDRAVDLLPDQEVLLDGTALARLFNLAAAIVRAQDLVGHLGIARHPATADLGACEMLFDEDEVIWASGGLCLYCGARGGGASARFEWLTPAQARLFRLTSGTACADAFRAA